MKEKLLNLIYWVKFNTTDNYFDTKILQDLSNHLESIWCTIKIDKWLIYSSPDLERYQDSDWYYYCIYLEKSKDYNRLKSKIRFEHYNWTWNRIDIYIYKYEEYMIEFEDYDAIPWEYLVIDFDEFIGLLEKLD